MEGFAALAEPHRRRMVELLASGERAAGQLGAEFDISAPAISQHLKVLREAGLVSVRVEGQRRIYSLDPAAFQRMEAWLGKMRSFWSHRLDALERELNEGDGT